METVVVFDKSVFNGKTEVLNKTFKTLDEPQIIAAKNTLVEATKKPKKPTPQHTLNTRELVDEINNDLLTLSKVSKVVHRYLRLDDSQDNSFFKSMLSEKQLPKFNEWQYNQLLKSPKLVTKMLTPKQVEAFITNGRKCSPTQYINAIKKGACMNPKTFTDRKKS